MMRALEAADPGATPFDEPRRREIFCQFVRDDTYGQAWLIVVDGKPVGYVVLTVSFSFEYRGYDAFIDELYIAGEHRQRELGARQ
jgi:predicted acetyltransferase